jgi:sulfur-oxidizing protein SoxZ
MSSIKIRSKRKDGYTQIRTLIAHPMETGRRREVNGEIVPAHYIQELTIKYNDKVLASGVMGAGISKDPYFAFKVKGGAAGDKISITWIDNLGNEDQAESIVK